MEDSESMTSKTILTHTGKAYNVNWLGVSGIDKSLRFELAQVNITEAFTVFNDSNETEVIIYRPDRPDKQVYEGYTTLISISADSANSVVVALAKGE